MKRRGYSRQGVSEFDTRSRSVSMAESYQSIQNNLGNFYEKWKSYTKNERQGYITFLTDFFECFGIAFDDPNKLPFERNTGKGFADAYIKDVVIIEMKDKNKVKTEIDLLAQLPQALRYWEGSGKSVPFLILSNFSFFVVYDTRDKSHALVRFAQLENRAASFNFLLRLNPSFVPEQEAVTKKSAKIMGELYQSLKSRTKDHEEDVDLFVLQCLFCLFSEDIGYLPAQTFTTCVRKIKDGEDNSANILSTLFKMMDEKDDRRKRGKFEQVRYFNGPLFQKKPEIVLDDEEVELLWNACQLDWTSVRPEIFGALFESTQSKKARHKDGMHFTSEEDILKVIRPCILQPWEEEFKNASSLSDLRKLHKKLKSFRVLDPACGSGNFLVVAYREIKALEAKIFMEYKRISKDSYSKVQQTLEWFPVTNMYGIEINEFPSFLTKVSLWITKKIVRNKFKLTEPDLPLEDLKHIVAGDSLEIRWDDVDAVVGNPPFIGCKQIRDARGDEYYEKLGEKFAGHNKMADYCTYWYAKVLEDVKPGVRVGLVSTNTVSQSNSREASLDRIIAEGGTIFNAVSTQKWSGEAKVHVSIVNYTNKKPHTGPFELDGEKVPVISSRLLPFTINWEPKPLLENSNRAFQGVTALGKGFILDRKQALTLKRKNKKNSNVIKEFISASHVTDAKNTLKREWIIDFQDWELQDAQEYKEIFDLLKAQIESSKKKSKRTKTRAAVTGSWWKFWRPRPELRKAIKGKSRYILVSRHTKFPVFIFESATTALPEDSTVAIAFDDYEHLGVLNSRFHSEWAYYQGSTLKADLRYTNESVFETFPFPEKISSRVGGLMREIEKYRNLSMKSGSKGLTDIYNELEAGGHTRLKRLHQNLDKAVSKCYGFPTAKITDKETLLKFLCGINKSRHLNEVRLAEQEERRAKREAVLEKARRAKEKAARKSSRKLV